MNVKKGFILTCIMIASASLYYVHATDSNVQESGYAQFATSYEALFKEAPAQVWAKNSPNSVESKPSCSGCAAM